MRSKMLTHLIEFESTDAEFAHAAYLSFLFAFRVPSGTLSLPRDFSDDPLDTFSPQLEKDLIGARVIAGEPFLIAKLSRRKNL